MDSAHEEPELPSALTSYGTSLQGIVRSLEGRGNPLKRLPYLHWPEFQEFFPERASLSTITGWRSQVRLRVLEAIGNCNTFEVLNVHDIFQGDISRLTASEWDVVFRGFRSSTILQLIQVHASLGRSDTEWESFCLQLGRILNSSSVTELKMDKCRLSTKCYLILASGIQTHSDSKLKSLDLYKAWRDASALKHVADMINSAPLLETLSLGGDRYNRKVDFVGVLSQALIQSSSLKELTLKHGVRWGAPLLLKALAGDDRNRSIERLHLKGIDRLGDCLGEILISNPSLKEVKLCWLRTSLDWQKIGEVIRDNVIATTIRVKFRFGRDNWKSIEALAQVKDPTVELEIVTEREEEVLLPLKLLGRVLRGEIKSLKSLSIRKNSERIITFSILPRNGKTGETSVQKRLKLSGRSEDLSRGVWEEDLSKGAWEDLLRCMQGNHLTHLDLSDSELDEEAFRDLMGVLQVNLALQEIDVSGTSWARDGKAAQIQEVLKQNKERAVYMSVFREANLTFGDAKAGRLFLCRSPRAESIISYLNDVGSIIYIPNLDYIIVDPNWLTNTFLGELIALGQNFQAIELESSNRTSSYASKDGFVSETVFARLIEEFLGNQLNVQRGVTREELENILVHLDLCFQLKDTSQYFIPSFIPEHASKEEHNDQELAHVKWMIWANTMETSQFFSIRIQCQDATTMSLTAAFFPRFQMFMRRKLISEMGVSEENVICSRHYLRLFLDGHQIYIEHIQSEKSHKYVDVLMLCSSQKSREVAIKYVRKHIVHELISFCASPKGCPGVALVLGVIQTICVKMLIPSHLRGAILIEKLKSDFIRSINDKLEEMPLERSYLMEKEELFHYEHCWPPIESYTSERSERARDLLWERDVEAVVNEIRQNRIQQLDSLQEGLISVDNDLAQCYPEAKNMVGGSNVTPMKGRKPLASRCLSRASTSAENRSTRLLLSKFGQLEEKVDALHRKVDDLDERLREVHSIMQRVDMKIEHILSVQQELQSTLSVFMSKVDRIIGFSEAFQQGKTPKRPYVTDDVGLFYRLNAGLHVGTTVRLHLMCESVTGFHTIKDQEGLKLRLDLKNCKWIRRTIEISYKVIYYGAKAALTKFFGLGEAIPAWADLESDIVKLDGISREDRKAVLKGGESKELNEAWLRIQQILAPCGTPTFRASAAPRTEFACAQANACAQEDVQVPRRRRIRRGPCLRTGRS
ncbi:hypothetical protein AXG93_2958s1020 [Marchantia polymorpha subsp. ruderalis]|uniref:C-terminal of Roc (COR) domain-containing protein n=1 Tax=Marchantia polymorpha subsp. ruderalis TaxID=1480154 RepID=A0A176VFK0_MARPO|nr:hypothetical protein AXG93_2958s1020 [Marchantia polymorpha subsp. ruderalis]